jgi:hypothetical protein
MSVTSAAPARGAPSPAGRGTGTRAEVRVPGFLATRRRDRWWVSPLLVAGGLTLFGVYSFWAALQNAHYQWGPYLSPFYSPLITPEGWPISPAFLILWAPLGFRATCYYYRKAYYRAMFGSPPACAVGSVTGASYKGEHKGLFVLMNLHRFFLYLALVFIVILWIDVFHATRFATASGGTEFGVGVGTLVLLVNTVLLSAFTFGCNSLRHLVGGGTDCFSCAKGGKAKYGLWRFVTLFNERHMLWAWCSLFSVGLADLYVRLLSMGVIHDARLI